MGGNLLVAMAFKIDRRLQTITNGHLALADFSIGLVSMPLFSVYLLLGRRWPLGAVACDLWLSVDYTMSNASVANLLVISFDRFLSVKRPLMHLPGPEDPEEGGAGHRRRLGRVARPLAAVDRLVAPLGRRKDGSRMRLLHSVSN